ncbi:MAG: tyrosinase family protein, partial [Acidobacteria bacterium]|nr:tyrosinase family protein [Acidobacteriota bacterium]
SRPGFLSWHRAYILDLERELQAIDPSVTLPYWRFDQGAPAIFQLDFLGVSNGAGVVSFAPNNPLQFWRTDSQTGITRVVPFNINNAPPGVLNQAGTLALGNSGALFANFRGMENNPHGSAHVSFSGASFIRGIGSAARDPLFFLLHCNVDRLWALWQRANNRYDANTPQSFDTNNLGNKAGHNLNDTMWPWNGITGGGRPATAPGGALASSPCVAAPGPQPRVRDCMDFMGKINPAANLGFCYDDVPF